MTESQSTPPHDRDVSARLDAAVSMARAAGELTLRFFQREDCHVERKEDDSPVTQADRQAEELMRERIAQQFPDDGILGEEFGETAGTSPYSWILDPIDGTKSFISGVPLYSVLVGVVHQRISIAGVILVPGLQECVYASKGHGAWWSRGDQRPIPAKVSTCSALREGLFITSQVDSFSERHAADAYLRLERSAYMTRTWGDGYGYLLVATGRAAAMVDPIMNVWDAAALQPVLVEAGGTFTDWRGRGTIYSGDGVATNGHVLEEVLAITREYPQPS